MIHAPPRFDRVLAKALTIGEKEILWGGKREPDMLKEELEVN